MGVIRNQRLLAQDVFLEQMETKEQYITTGWSYLDKAIGGLKYGVFMIPGQANRGKSTFMICVAMKIIENTKDSFVLDFSLDDDRETRYTNMLANATHIPINDLKLGKNLSEEELKKRYLGEQYLGEKIFPHMEIKDGGDCDKRGKSMAYLDVIENTIREIKEEEPDKKLIVCIDGFHNILVDGRMERNDKDILISSTLKRITEQLGVTIFISTHTTKGFKYRGLEIEAIKGSGQSIFDAKIIGSIYSDYKSNYTAAKIWWPKDGEMMPVLELAIVKSKVSSFSGTVFFYHTPDICKLEEATPTWQDHWNKIIYQGVAPVESPR